ncbi:MAG TPA: succinate--CoA ligase subunit alpha [Anaerolineaceae bacterium]
MSILINKQTRLLVQGITGHEGLFHTRQMVRFGTNVVAGVTPGRGGEWVLDGKIPVFDTVKTAVETTGANASVIFVPAKNALEAMYEAGDARIPLVVCITEGIPVKDSILANFYLRQNGVRLVGPNSPGILTPGEAKAGIIPNHIAAEGNIGVVSRSGTLTYEVLQVLQMAGLGASTCVGIGGDSVIGTNFIEILELFETDAHTDQIVLIGEIGGTDEERAAEYITSHLTKPVVAFIAGKSAPPGKRMGHAGAIIERGEGSAGEKIRAFEAAGVRIANHPEEIPVLLRR